MEIQFIDWGKIDYAEALKKQTEIFQHKVKQKLNGEKEIKQDFIVCEHNNVYTIGLHGKDSNMLVSDDFLRKINAKVFHINRGGDITYHGPGQITGYPILDIDALNIGLRDYINTIEQMVINVMDRYGIKCGRLHGATGVWIDADKTAARKICAIGVKASRGITMHGFALNVNTDLNYFNYINPCGFTDKKATSMEKELGYKVELSQIEKEIYTEFVNLVK